ncbi:MAG: hypothetical protein KJN97_09490, partial [Deltaproteobacteria bacterium]|nr:hypothetical protein [Deltaproteobacteria bacterium]
AFGIACWRVYRGSLWLLFAIIGFNVANVSMFFPQLVGIEAMLAGQPTALTLVILVQILVTLVMVGWLSRHRRPILNRTPAAGGLGDQLPSATA